MLPVVAFGVKLFGVGPITRFDLGEERHRGIAVVFAIVFSLSFVVGVFFPYRGVGGDRCRFSSADALDSWTFRAPSDRRLAGTQSRQLALRCSMGILGVTWVQALVAFNFCAEAAFSQDAARALQDIRLQASPDDVVAFLPGELTERPVWGHTEISTNYSITAMTGLDGYF